MDQYLYRLNLTRLNMIIEGPTKIESEIIAEHYAYLQDLVEKNIVLMAGRTMTEDENIFGVVVLEAESDTSARKIMDNDPSVKRGVMKAELFPYSVALWSDKWPSNQ